MQTITPAERSYALIVDDHPLVAQGFSQYLMSHCGFVSTHIASSERECWHVIDTFGPPIIAIIDFWLPDGAALPLIQQFIPRCSNTRVLVVSGDDDTAITKLTESAGAHGFLHKQSSPESFANAIAILLEGNKCFPSKIDGVLPTQSKRELLILAEDLGLTKRQCDVLNLILRGLPNKRIARDLNISEQTVKEHMTNILFKLGVSSRLEVVNFLRGRRLESSYHK